jgi:hypothetical protein
MTTLAQAQAGARRLAKFAAIRDQGVAACPYPAEGTPAQRVARRLWIRTYLHHRPPIGRVDYRSDLDYLADSSEDGEASTPARHSVAQASQP